MSIQVCGGSSSGRRETLRAVLRYQASLRQSHPFSSKRELATSGISGGKQNDPTKQTTTSHTSLCSPEISIKDGEVQN